MVALIPISSWPARLRVVFTGCLVFPFGIANLYSFLILFFLNFILFLNFT